jgi:competence ComEA-like helix-hairpin-helix protein
VNINTASFEELRGAEFSVTQATRVLAYRERFGGYSSVDDLARVPGFSPETIAAIRDRISI